MPYNSRLKSLLSFGASAISLHKSPKQAFSLKYQRIFDFKRVPQAFDPNIRIGISQDNFEKQLEYLALQHQFISVDNLASELSQGRLPKSSLSLSFDGGYKDILTRALPLLEKYHAPAVIFICPGLIDQPNTTWWYELEEILRVADQISLEPSEPSNIWETQTAMDKNQAFSELSKVLKTKRPADINVIMNSLRSQVRTSFDFSDQVLSWEEIKQLSHHPLITIGAQSLQYCSLKSINATTLMFDLRQAKSKIESAIGGKVQYLSYPYGTKYQVGKREYSAASEIGYHAAFTSIPGGIAKDQQEKLMQIPRIEINYFDTVREFKRKVR